MSATANIHPRGIHLFCLATLKATWVGEGTPPPLTMRERFVMAKSYIKARSPKCSNPILRAAKALAFVVNPSQVSTSGNPMVTTGRSLLEEWATFSLTECTPPHSGHGNPLSASANASN